MAKIVFAQELYFPIQSTQCLSGYLKRSGHSTDVAIGSPSEILEYIEKSEVDLIAFTVLTTYRNHMLETIDVLKNNGVNIPIIAGGYDITFMPHIIDNADIDIICVGEGGEAIVELADCIDRSIDYTSIEIKNLHIKREDGSIKKNPMRYWNIDLDLAPFDDRDIYYDKDEYFSTLPFMQVLAGRGCPYPCTYCFNEGYKQIHTKEGMKGREYTTMRSVDHVIRELKFLAEKYNPADFFFNDSTLTYNRKWILEFCDKYIENEIKQTFSINSVIPELTEEVCVALASTKKCRLIRFGLETGNEEFRYKTLRKKVSNQKLFETTKLLQKYNLRYSMQMMLGLPGETLSFAWDTIRVARKLSGKDSVHGVNIFKPFPGLEINNIGLELGEYQTSDVVAPGSIPPAVRPESINYSVSKGSSMDLPVHESYSSSRATMKSTDRFSSIAGADSGTVFGSQKMAFYDNYRRDEIGMKILKLSRYSHLAIRFPDLENIINKIIELPDNPFNKMVWFLTEGWLNIRVHAAAPLSYFVKYFLFHRNKAIR